MTLSGPVYATSVMGLGVKAQKIFGVAVTDPVGGPATRPRRVKGLLALAVPGLRAINSRLGSSSSCEGSNPDGIDAPGSREHQRLARLVHQPLSKEGEGKVVRYELPASPRSSRKPPAH